MKILKFRTQAPALEEGGKGCVAGLNGRRRGSRGLVREW